MKNAESLTLDGDSLRNLIGELSAEIDFLAKPFAHPKTHLRAYPDAANLSSVERRLLVRSVFSFIEAIVFQLKAIGLLLDKSNRLSSGEVALAKEEDYELDDSGEVQIKTAKLGFLKNLKFAFMLFTKAAELDYKLDTSGSNWQDLQKILKVRHRITHPKKHTDLEVTDYEVRAALRTFEWVFHEVGYLMMVSLAKNLKGRNKT